MEKVFTLPHIFCRTRIGFAGLVAMNSSASPSMISTPVFTARDVKKKYVDIGINLTDPVYQGVYVGKKIHESDLEHVIHRAINFGCLKMMITGSDLKESRRAVQLAEDYRTLFY